MTAPSIPGQIGDCTMILVPVCSIVGEDHVRRYSLLQFFEKLLDFFPFIRKKAIAEVLDDDLLMICAFEEKGCAVKRLTFALSPGTKDNPKKLRVGMLGKHPKDCPAATNFNVIRVRAEAQDS